MLLIDDDSTTNFLNKLLLTRTLGITQQVLVAENGLQALQLLDTHCTAPDGPSCPELILLDMNMPVMNGLAFLEAYAKLPLTRRQHTIVAMLTTSLLPQDEARARQLPITDFLNKPLTREKLLALVQQHFPAPPQ